MQVLSSTLQLCKNGQHLVHFAKKYMAGKRAFRQNIFHSFSTSPGKIYGNMLRRRKSQGSECQMSKVWRFLKVRRSVSDIPEKIFGYTWLQVFETITVKGFSDIIGKWNAFTWKGFHPIKKEEKTISGFWKKDSRRLILVLNVCLAVKYIELNVVWLLSYKGKVFFSDLPICICLSASIWISPQLWSQQYF